MTETARLVIAVDSRQVGQGETDLARLGKTSSAVEREVKSLTGALAGLAAPLAAAFSVKSIYDSAEAYSTLTNRLRLVTDGAVALAAAQQSVFTIAQNARQPLEATAELYQRIATNQTALKLSGQGVADIVSTISKTLAISGASAESSKAALVQLGQAFASGTLRGEELNSVMEQAPALSQAIAAGMGKTVGQLRSLGAEGKLTAEEVVKALQKQAGAVDALFGKMTATVGGGLTTIGNSFTNYVGQIDQATGASGKLANEILSVSKAIDGSLPGTLSTLKENASSLVQVLETGLYVAAGRVASVFIQQAGAAGVAAVANQALLKSEAESARQTLATAQARQADSKSLVERAALDVKAAEVRVASDRAMQVSQIANLKNVQAALTAELALEQQRLKAQITDQGRAASVARMAEVRLAEIAIIKQVEVAERSLSATTIATSAQAATAYAGRTAAVLAFGETTATVNALAAASSKATAAASLTGQALTGLRSAGAGLLGIMGGPVGLAVIAGAVALSFVDFSSKSKTLMGDLGDLGKSVDQVRTEFNKLNADQQKAQVNAWKDKQLGAALAVEEAYKGLKSTIEAALIETPNADIVDLAKVAEQARAYDAVIEKLDAAKASGQALGPVLREAAASGQISPAQLKGWEAQAGVISDNISVVNQINERLGVQTSILDQNTSSTQANNVAKAGFTDAGEKYLGTLQKQLGKLQDNNDAVKEASRYLEEHKDLSEADRAAILSTSYAIKAQDDANKAALKTTRDSNSEAKKHATEVENLAKKLREFSAESALAAKSATDMATAYLNGADSVRDLSIEQKAQEQVLKTGADSYDMVKAALIGLRDAEDSRNIAQSIANMRVEVTQTLAQATATLQGKDALEAFNIQKSMSVALAGKNIELGSKEYELLLQQTKAQLEANKALEQANSVEGIVDRLNPQIKLLKDYRTEQDALNAAIARYPENAAVYQDALTKLGNEYEVNRNKATLWGQMTEAAVDRIDDAFADMWKSVLSKSGNFMDTLKNSFRQFLAEMLHMAITKPIIVQIASSFGVGSGSSGGLSSLLGGGGSGGGMNLQSMFDTANKAYGVATSAFGDAVTAGWSAGEGFLGGIQGAFKAGSSYLTSSVGSLFGSAASSSGAMVNGVYQLSANTGAATVDLISNTVTSSSGAVTGSASAATTTAATGLGAASAVMYGIGGAIQGYLKAGVKGAVAGAGGAVAGAYAGAAIGSAIPVIGTAIGAAIGAVLGGMFGSSLFGGDWITKDEGFQLGVTDGELDSASFEYQKKKGGLFSSNKKRTRLTAMDPEMQSALDKTYAVTLGSVIGLFDSLDVELSDGVLDGLNMAATQISTRDKTAEQIQEELAKWFTGLGDAAVAEVNKVTSSGLDGFTLEGLTTFVNNLYSVNDSLEMLGVKAVAFNISGGRAIENLVALAGGMEALNKSMTNLYNGFTTEAQKSVDTLDGVRAQFKAMGLTLPATREAFAEAVKGLDLTSQAEREIFNSMTANAEQAAAAYTILEQRQKAYNGAFLSESEQTALTISETTAQIKEMGITLPGTRQGFRDMVESLDQTTESGKSMYDSLMSVAGAAGVVFDALEAQAEALKQTLISGVGTASSALTRAVEAGRKQATDAYNARVTSLNDMASTASKSVSDLTTLSSSLESALKALNGTSDDAVKTLRAQAQATLQSALATARAGGSLSGFTGLDDALDTVSSNNTDLYTSMEDFARDQGRTANVVAELNAINGKQLTSAELTAKTLDEQLKQAKLAYDNQISAFDAQLEFAQAQLDAINGVDNSIMSVTDAVNAMNAAVIAALGTVKSATPTNAGTLIDTVYKDVLGRDADKDGKHYWQGQVSSGAVGYDQLAGAIKTAATENAIKDAYSSVLGRNVDAEGAKYWADQVASGALTVSQLQQAIANAAKANGSAVSVPGYASGGDFGGGLRLVGENGPELEVTGPSRIFNANQTAAMLKGGGDAGMTVAEIRELRREMQSNATYMAQLTKDVADGIDTLVQSGVQIIGTVDTRAVSA